MSSYGSGAQVDRATEHGAMEPCPIAGAAPAPTAVLRTWDSPQPFPGHGTHLFAPARPSCSRWRPTRAPTSPGIASALDVAVRCGHALLLSEAGEAAASHAGIRRRGRNNYTTLYRVKMRCPRDAGLRFGLVGRLRHDRGSCLSVCCI